MSTDKPYEQPAAAERPTAQMDAQTSKLVASSKIMMVDDASRRLVGQIVPACASTVVMITGDDEPVRVTTSADSMGRFSFDDVPTERVGFAVLDSSGHPMVQTQRIEL